MPRLPVQQGSNGHLVYVVNQAGVAEVRPVVVGDYYGEKEIVMVSGLHAGDRSWSTGCCESFPASR